MSNFTHLHVHTQYSILDGASKIVELFKKAKELNMNALAITDHGNMFGVKEFHNEARKAGIKPIIGCEIYVASKSRFEKTGVEDRSGHHLILLAKNITGYQNLCKLVTYAWKEGFYYKPRIDWELLRQYHEGLIASSACLAGEIPAAISEGDLSKAEQKLKDYLEVFGEDFYLEMIRHKTGNPDIDSDTLALQNVVNEELKLMSKKFGVKLIATNDVHFIKSGDAEAHDRMLCINTGKLVSDIDRLRYTQQEFLKSEEEMLALFEDMPEAVANTAEVAAKVEEYELNQKPILPEFPIPENFTDAYAYLEHLTWKGAEFRYPEMNDETTDRIMFELSVIKNMGFAGYFLIVHDFINAARDMGVSVGPGRGSAAGSVVAYCLRITNIDPLSYGLLFERFLNPDRISMPDMDIDFDEDGRDRVIRWVVDKYGTDKVAQIVTFGTMAAKMAIRDVARVENLPLPEADRLAKMVPTRPGVLLKDAFKEVKELNDARNSENELISRTLKYAEELEGSVRHTGLHACGIIIGRDELINHIPLCTSKDSDLLVTQYEGSHVESVGLLKMDFLGLKTLSIIKDAIENIKKSKGKEINVEDLTLDDPLTYELFSKGNTTAIFQFESEGMKKYLKDLKPNRFEDLIAMNALYRPGPIGQIPLFVNRKLGREKVLYDHPMMEDALKETFGITVYQEQLMNLSRFLGGFTRGEADTLRKAMSKKQKDVMGKMKTKFIEGCSKNDIKNDIAEKIWHDWDSFADYAFNKSHSACYAVTAYNMAYLKAHYPAEFMAAVLSRNVSDIKEITFLIDDCRKMNIKVLGPDVNESETRFTVNEKGEIRFGLSAIKGLGDAAVEAIINDRNANGMFRDVFDFLNRVNLRTVNKKSIEALVMAGAFDSMNTYRAQFFYKEGNEETTFLEKMLKHIAIKQSKQGAMQHSLFGESNDIDIPDPVLPTCERWSEPERLKHEKEVIGFYMSGHPLDQFQIEIESFSNFKLERFSEGLPKFKDKTLKFGGMIVSAQHKISKNNKPYCSFEMEDYTGTYQFTIFSENYQKHKHLLDTGSNVFITALVKNRYKSEELEISILSIEPLYDLLEKKVKTMILQVPLSQINEQIINELKSNIEENPGNTELKLRITDENEQFHIDMFMRRNKVNCNGFIKNNELVKNMRFKLN